jgi:hypothetical protein
MITENSFIFLRVDPFIWQDPNLSTNEKIILNLTLGFAAQDKPCYVSSEWIGHYFGLQEQFVDEMLLKLQAQGFIKINKYHPRGRSIWFILDGREDPSDREDNHLVDVW